MDLGGRADNGSDVPAFRVFHGDGSEDDGEVEEMALHRGGHRGIRGDAAASQPRGLRATLCIISCWTNSDAD